MLALFMLSAISTAVFQPVPTEYKLVWNDEFEVDGVADSRYWAYEEGFVRNEELQWYQAENAFCQQGKLIIEARKENRDRRLVLYVNEDMDKYFYAKKLEDGECYTLFGFL